MHQNKNNGSNETKFGHARATPLHINLAASPLPISANSPMKDFVDDAYIEDDPTVGEWLLERTPSWNDAKNFVLGLFPFLSWIGRYNLQWFYGDLVAGITVGAVVIPQGMAYARLALLPPEFGLYSSFVGVLLYWFFATSKDVTIGPVAVMSTLVGDIVAKMAETHPNVQPYQTASALAIVTGSIILLLGLARLGFLVDYIPLPAIAAFTTACALNIVIGQIPSLMGISTIRGSTYRILLHTLKMLSSAKIDAILGLSALFILYMIRWATTSWAATRFPKWKRVLFFASTLRTVFVILLYTMISWLVNMDRKLNPTFKVVGKVPRGLQHIGVPKINGEIISAFVPELPAAVIVLLIEHIAVAKSFGRVNNYTINPSQELIAIGIANILGPFFGAYPATGSFSRTAIKSKAGVRTPFAGVVTAVIVLLAIYALTTVFFYIPQAALSAVIIHAVGDLITTPNTVYKFWRISPIEVFIFFAGVIVTVFSTIENGIYLTVVVSGILLLFRKAKARGQFLGRVTVRSVAMDDPIRMLSSPSQQIPRPSKNTLFSIIPSYAPSLCSLSGITDPNSFSGYTTPINSSRLPLVMDNKGTEPFPNYATFVPTPYQNETLSCPQSDDSIRSLFLPIDRTDGSNPDIELLQPYSGVFIYRFSEGLVYSNAAQYTDHLVSQISKWTRKGAELSLQEILGRPGDRAWNDPGPQKAKNKHHFYGRQIDIEQSEKPLLRAIILDFSSVNNVDITSVQALIDVRNQLDLYAAPEKVEWHFVGIANRWTKRALASVGFGSPSIDEYSEMDGHSKCGGEYIKRRWKPVFSVAEVGGIDSDNSSIVRLGQRKRDEAIGAKMVNMEDTKPIKKIAIVSSVIRPFFHPDLDEAVRSAISNIEGQLGRRCQ